MDNLSLLRMDRCLPQMYQLSFFDRRAQLRLRVLSSHLCVLGGGRLLGLINSPAWRSNK